VTCAVDIYFVTTMEAAFVGSLTEPMLERPPLEAIEYALTVPSSKLVTYRKSPEGSAATLTGPDPVLTVNQWR
jgi:hypothetical protein